MTVTTCPPGGYSLAPVAEELCPNKSAALDAILARKRGIALAKATPAVIEAKPSVEMTPHRKCACQCGRDVVRRCMSRAIYFSHECKLKVLSVKRNAQKRAERAARPKVVKPCRCECGLPATNGTVWASPACRRKRELMLAKERKAKYKEILAKKEAAHDAGTD